MAIREKSAMYPGVTWKDCMDFIKVVDSFKSKTVAYSTLAQHYGLKSLTTKSFTSKIGAAKQFGLITTSNMTLQLTRNANKILYPTEGSVRDIELECFVQAPLYSKLIELYNGKLLPDVEVLANVLMNNFKITKSAKDQAAKVFLESCDQMELIETNTLTYKTKIKVENKKDKVEESRTESNLESTKSDANVQMDLQEDTTEQNEFIIQKYPVESGKMAEIRIPIDATEDDLWAIRDILDIIMKRKFKIKM